LIKKIYPVSLAVRWSAGIAALVILVMLLLGWFLIEQQQMTYRKQGDLLGSMLIEQLSRAVSEPLMADDRLSLEVLVSQQLKNELISGVQLYDDRGQKLLGGGSAPPVSVIRQQGIQRWSNDADHVAYYMEPVRYQGTGVGLAVIGIDQRPLERTRRSTLNALLLTTLGLIAVGVMLAVPLARRFARPIQQLVEVGEAIDRGEQPVSHALQRPDEIGQLLAAFWRLASSLEGKRDVGRALSRYLAPSVASRVLESGRARELGGSRREGSVLFCDIVGFTELSENQEPEQVAELLNNVFGYFVMAGSSCRGTVDKFIGDCIMILFGIPEQDDRHAFHALTCAVLIQSIAERLNQQRAASGKRPVTFRIGINSGTMLAGNLGSDERMQYTVVGDTVNVASRICALAEPGGILLTAEAAVQSGVAGYIRPSPLGDIQVRGRKGSVTLYETDLALFAGESLLRESLDMLFP